MKIMRDGQSALLVEAGATRIFIDPGSFCSDDAFALTGLAGILITHEHPDHCDPERIGQLLAANPTAPAYAPSAVLELLAPHLNHAEAGRARPVVAGEPFGLGEFGIEPVGALHQEILPTIPRCANSGFVVTGPDGTRLFHPGDSYETIPPGIDVLALPLVAPWSTLPKTIEFVQAVAPRRMFAIHDAFLSNAGHALYWRLLTGAVDTSIEALDVPVRGTVA